MKRRAQIGKRFITLLVTMIMMVTMMPTLAFAADVDISLPGLSVNINYKAKRGGSVGINSELIEETFGDYPDLTGTATANDGYKFLGWKSDKDVPLKDGATVAAGTYLTTEQVQNVDTEQLLQNSDKYIGGITFTAYFERTTEVEKKTLEIPI